MKKKKKTLKIPSFQLFFLVYFGFSNYLHSVRAPAWGRGHSGQRKSLLRRCLGSAARQDSPHLVACVVVSKSSPIAGDLVTSSEKKRLYKIFWCVGTAIVLDGDVRVAGAQYYFCAGEFVFSVFKVPLENKPKVLF